MNLNSQKDRKILVTGAAGFIGKNLVAQLRGASYTAVYTYDKTTDPALLDAYTADCTFVFHLAGVNRPEDPAEFTAGNCGFTAALLDSLRRNGNLAPVLFASSIQAERDNPYGNSKRAAEEMLAAYARETGAPVLIYRLPNVFGKWCRPQYNSVVATFCYNIARDLPIQIHDPAVELQLVYIDDVAAEFLRALEGEPTREGAFCRVPVSHRATLGQIAALLRSFRASRVNRETPDVGDPLSKKLYSTYLSYLPEEAFAYPLKMNVDARGSFTEFLRSPDRGQVSVNVSHPGITKGNHWHHTKNEKFLVVSGRGVIRFRKPDSTEILEYPVSGDKLEVVDIPVGYTHSIVNTGDTDMVTVMWANEPFDPERPDTYYLEV